VRALTNLATAAARARDPEHARNLLALAISMEPSEISWWIGTVSHLFPSAIRGAGHVFTNAYNAGV
jgi:hypothetical protein